MNDKMQQRLITDIALKLQMLVLDKKTGTLLKAVIDDVTYPKEAKHDHS